MTGSRATRRGFLALGGAAALAGCSTLRSIVGTDAVTLDGGAVADVASGSTPTVAEPLPVPVADTHVRASRERAESALASAPLPLGPEEVPNGAMREELAHTVEHAREVLVRAEEAPGRREHLDALRHARWHAREVAGSWAYVTGDLTPADLRTRAGRLRSAARTYREERAYVGDDPARAVLVHDAVESWVETAAREAERDPDERDPTNALTVGERAGELENGRAHLSDARHVGERFRASLSDPGSVRSTLESARESLTGTVRDRRDPLPGERADPAALAGASVDDETTVEVLETLHRRIPDGDDLAADALAGDVLARLWSLAAIGAFESVRDRVEDGERFGVGSVDDLRSRRQSAVEAIGDALERSDDRRLARHVLAGATERLTYADEELRRYGEGDAVEAQHLDREVAGYVAVAATARAVPDACAETLAALDADV